MKFENLLTSISNNADKKPSILLALCMVQSLFEDVTRAAGKDDISLCAAGDEALPSKLIWLSRNLLWIYEENKALFQSGHGRLESVITKLKQAEQELSSLEQAGNQLQFCQEQYDALLKKLPAARSRAAEYEVICGKLAQARQELADLEQHDPDKANTELTQLTDQLAQLDSQRSSLQDQLREKKQQKASLSSEVCGLKTEAGQLDQALRGLASSKEALNLAIGESLEKQDQLSIQLSELETAKASLLDEFEQKTKEVKIAADRVEEYQKNTLAPVQTQLTELQSELQQLEQTKETTEREYSRINSRRMELILEISRIKSTREIAEADLAAVKENHLAALQEKAQQDSALEQAINNLSTLQKEVEELKNVRLPEAEGMLEEEGNRKKLLEQELQSNDRQRSQMLELIEQLNQKLPGQRTSLQNTKAAYDSLTAEYTASTLELEKLEREIQLLTSRSDAEKLVTYSQQMKDKRDDLEKLRMECAKLAEENSLLDREYSNQQDHYTMLLEQKQKHDAALSDTKQMIAKLQFVCNPDYLHRLDLLLTRLSTLQQIHDALSASIARIRTIRGADAVPPDAVLENTIKTELHKLAGYTDELRMALIHCSENLKLEDTK